MRIFAIGDVHLSLDDRIKKPMDIFGQNWANHHEKMQRNWIEDITSKDIIIIPGDISWALRLEEAMADLEFLDKLPGRKILTKGNHDLWWASITKLKKLPLELTFIQNNSYIVETPEKRIGICGTRGWIAPGSDGFTAHDEKIFNREVRRLELSLEHCKMQDVDEIIVALHYPPTNDKKQESLMTKTLSDYGVKTCVYGHLHGKEGFKNGIKGTYNGVAYELVSFDYINGKPLLIYDDNK